MRYKNFFTVYHIDTPTEYAAKKELVRRLWGESSYRGITTAYDDDAMTVKLTQIGKLNNKSIEWICRQIGTHHYSHTYSPVFYCCVMSHKGLVTNYKELFAYSEDQDSMLSIMLRSDKARTAVGTNAWDRSFGN
jgi:hypothetical protein